METIIDAAPQSPRLEPTRLVYDGRTGELFRLWLPILLLNVVTLGFYRFWGRARLRKYLWSRVILEGDRLEYDGTGGELFRRFLVALVILLPLILLPTILKMLGVGTTTLNVVEAARGLVLVYLLSVAYYGGRRYRLSRTLWRGIRGGLDGSPYAYGVLAFASNLMVGVTLGLARPWQYTRLWTYETAHAGFGDAAFTVDVSGRKLLRPLAGWYAFNLAGAVLVGGTIYWAYFDLVDLLVPLDGDLDGHSLHPLWILASVIALAALGCGALLYAGYLHFSSRALRYVIANTRFRGVSLATDIRSWDLFRLQAGNALLLLFTLGLASPFAAQRYLRFVCANLRLYGVEDLETLTQSTERRREGGEGLLQLLDTGGFA
jgi:uncharacterized membrane protein YjgN (DUF898 family)